jgi:hypothetical protein
MTDPEEGIFGSITPSQFEKQQPQDTENKEAYEGTDDAVYQSAGGKDEVAFKSVDLREGDKAGFPHGHIFYREGQTEETLTNNIDPIDYHSTSGREYESEIEVDSNTTYVDHYDFPDALPLLDTKTSYLVDRSFRNQATSKHTLTFTGKILGFTETYDPVERSDEAAVEIFKAQKKMRDKLRGNKFWHIKLEREGEVLCEFANCRLQSINFAAGRYYNSADYTVTFESTDLALDNLETYSESMEINATEGMGYFQAGNIISSHYYDVKFTRTGSSLVAHKAAKALRLISLKNDDQVMVAGDSRTFIAKTVTEGKSSIDISTGKVSIEYSCILVPNDVDTRFVVGISTDLSRTNGSIPTVKVAGTLKSLNDNVTAIDGFWAFQESLYGIVKNTAGLTINEQVRNAISPLDNYDNTKAGSEGNHSVQYNEHTNSVSYNYEYEIAEKHRITNTIKEKITIDTDRPKSIIARIPTMGKGNGPILQSMSATTAGTKTMAIEATFVKGKNFNTEYPSLEQLIIDETPQADVAFRLAIQDSWARNSNVAKASLEWIFSDSYMYARNPEDNIVSNFVIAEDEDQGYRLGRVDITEMWQREPNSDQRAFATRYFLVETENGQKAQRAVNENNAGIHPGYGAYHNNKFEITSQGSLTSLMSKEEVNYEKRNVYLVRVGCEVTRNRDQRKFYYYGVFRILVGQVNEDAADPESLPETHVDSPELLMVSNETVRTYAPVGIVVAKVELTDPDFMVLDYGQQFSRDEYIKEQTNISEDIINHPFYYVSGGTHRDLFAIRGNYLVTTEVLDPETDIGGSVETPLEEYNVVITAVESDSSGFVEKKSGKKNHKYNRTLDLKVVKVEYE